MEWSDLRIIGTPEPYKTQLISFQVKNANRNKGEVGYSAREKQMHILESSSLTKGLTCAV